MARRMPHRRSAWERGLPARSLARQCGLEARAPDNLETPDTGEIACPASGKFNKRIGNVDENRGQLTRAASKSLLIEVSGLIRLASEERGFSPAAENRPLLGGLAPEAELLQGLKALSTVLSTPAGLKPVPSRPQNEGAH